MEEVTAYIGLGSNLGDRWKNIQTALEALSGWRGIRLRKVSTLLETDPIGFKDQPRFMNCVAELQTSLEPGALHEACLAVERRMGRVRVQRWGPRTIDLDILLYGNDSVDSPTLKIPHPEIANRPFVQEGLRELNAHG